MIVPEQSGKVEYERERLLGITKKFINFSAIPSSLSRSYTTFPLCSETTLIEIAVYIHMKTVSQRSAESRGCLGGTPVSFHRES